MFSWKKGQRGAESAEVRSNSEKLAVDAGHSSSFTPFEGEVEDKIAWVQGDSVAPEEAVEPKATVVTEVVEPEAAAAVDVEELTASAVADVEEPVEAVVEEAPDAPAAYAEPVAEVPTQTEPVAAAMSLDIPLEVTAEPQFKRAFIGGYKKSSVMDYVYKVNSDMTSMKNNYERQFRDIAGERAQLSRECNLLHGQVQGYEEKVQNFDQAMEEKQQEIESKQERIEEARRLNNEMNAKLEQKETELETITTKMQESEQQLLNMRATVNQLSSEIDEHAALCERLEKSIQERDVQLASLQQIIQSLRVESSVMTSRNEALANTVNKLEHERSQIASLLGLQYNAPQVQSGTPQVQPNTNIEGSVY